MDYDALFAISAAGMAFEKKRVEVATLNLANMHSSAAPGTRGYQPLRVVTKVSQVDFSRLLSTDAVGLAPTPTASVVSTDVPPRLVHEPGHPHADEKGFVSYPAVDQATEMITAMTALRAYEANVAAVGFARSMAARALEIGGGR